MKILIKCVLSCFLVAQSTHATNDFNYKKSIPADPIKHHPWKLTTPEEDEINRRNQTLEGISEDNIHQRQADQHSLLAGHHRRAVVYHRDVDFRNFPGLDVACLR